MATCCPKTFTGLCLSDNTPIAVTIDNGVLISWTNLITGTVTSGNPPAGTGVCDIISIRPLDCSIDSITICTEDSIIVSSTDLDIRPLDCSTDSITTCPETTASAVNLSSPTVPDGVSISTRPGDWAIAHAPAAAVQATASKVAVPGVRHVATSISFSVITTTTAPTTQTLVVTLRDGATGAGTILMTWRVRVSAAMTDINVAQVTLGGLNVVGSVNTAMTLEFDAGDINTLESVNLTGYSVS